VLQDVDGAEPGTRYLNIIPESGLVQIVLKLAGASLTPTISPPTRLAQLSELIVLLGSSGRL
jgi:hypothetical protein